VTPCLHLRTSISHSKPHLHNANPRASPNLCIRTATVVTSRRLCRRRTHDHLPPPSLLPWPATSSRASQGIPMALPRRHVCATRVSGDAPCTPCIPVCTLTSLNPQITPAISWVGFAFCTLCIPICTYISLRFPKRYLVMSAFLINGFNCCTLISLDLHLLIF